MFADQQSRRKVTLDISPLLDVVFLLLIFFLVTTTFRADTGMDLELPESTTATQSDMAPTVVAVSQDGTVQLDGEAVSIDELRRAIEALPEADRDKITVRADSRASYGVIVTIIDALRSAGVNGLSLPMDSVDEPGGAGR